MKSKSLFRYLALHRRGYLFVGLWTAIWSILFIAFVWHFRFKSFGMVEGDPAMDAFLQMPVSDAIRITRYSALLALAPLAASLMAAILIFADTLLYVFHLDREKHWFEAVSWALHGWKALLAWMLAFCSTFLLAISFDHPVVVWASALLAVLLLCLLPFIAWNECSIAAKKPVLSSAPQWPGAKPILSAATLVAITVPLIAYYEFASEYILHPAASFFIDRVTEFIYATSCLVIAFMWVNRSKAFVFRDVVNLRSVGGFYSLNMMFGLWTLAILAPVVFYAALISVFLMPSIVRVYKDQLLEVPALLKYFDAASDFIVTYWSLLLLPLFYWVLVHAYGRLIFLLDLAPSGNAPKSTGTAED